MDVHSMYDSDNDMDNSISLSQLGQELNKSTEQSPMMASKLRSRQGKDVLFVSLCFVLATSVTLISSTFINRGRKYFVPDAATQILICILSISGIICLVVMLIYNSKDGQNIYRPHDSDHNGGGHTFRPTIKTVVLYIFGFGTLCHFSLQIVRISDCIRNGDTNEVFALVMYLSLALFSVVQLFLVLKHKGKRCTSFRSQIPIIFVVGANISAGFCVLIQETVDILDELGSNNNDQQELNSTGKLAVYTRCYNSSLSRYIEPVGNILYPFVIEFSLLATELMWFIWTMPFPQRQLIELEDLSHRTYNNTNSEQMPLLNGTRASSYSKIAKCRVSLIMSLIICVSTVIITFIAYFKHGRPLLHSTFVIMELLFSFLLFCSCGIGLFLGVSEDHQHKKMYVIGNPLSFFLTVGSVSVYHIFSIISSITLLCNNAKVPSPTSMYLGLFTDIFHLLASYLQSMFLGHCSMIKFNEFGQRQVLILRMCVFVAIANGSMWIENSFLPFRKIDNEHLVNSIDSEFYGVVGWILMSKILFPFCVYFRLESVIRALLIIKRI